MEMVITHVITLLANPSKSSSHLYLGNYDASFPPNFYSLHICFIVYTTWLFSHLMTVTPVCFPMHSRRKKLEGFVASSIA